MKSPTLVFIVSAQKLSACGVLRKGDCLDILHIYELAVEARTSQLLVHERSGEQHSMRKNKQRTSLKCIKGKEGRRPGEN